MLFECAASIHNNFSRFLYFSIQLQNTPQREGLTAVMLSESKKRKLFVLAIDSLREGNAKMHLDTYINGNKESIDLAYCHSHGKWIEWLI